MYSRDTGRGNSWGGGGGRAGRRRASRAALPRGLRGSRAAACVLCESESTLGTQVGATVGGGGGGGPSALATEQSRPQNPARHAQTCVRGAACPISTG